MGRSAKVYKKPTRTQRQASSASKATRAPVPQAKASAKSGGASKLAEKGVGKDQTPNFSGAQQRTTPAVGPKLAPHKAAYVEALAQGVRTPRDAGVDYLSQWEGKTGKRR